MAKKGPNIVFGLSRDTYSSDPQSTPPAPPSPPASNPNEQIERTALADEAPLHIVPTPKPNAETWGPAARGSLSLGYNPTLHPWIAKVIAQIDAELLDIGQDDQSRVALGLETRLPNGYLKRQLASPWIFSLEALNTFCEYNWESYAKVQATEPWPRVWFWVNEPTKGGARTRPSRGDAFAERGMLPK